MPRADDLLLDIGEVAARSGMAPSALRYYEQQGLIASADRRGLRRQYRPEVLRTLAVVAMCQRAGFSLADIRALLATGGNRRWKVVAARQRDELRRRISQLSAVADQLDHALGCPEANVFDCGHFRDALRRSLPADQPADRPGRSASAR
jgi:redox-sensitive transcriptional activator SoxR